MLSLAQSANYLFCLEWTSSDTGPKVLQYKKIKFNTSQESYKNFLDTCLINFKKSSINQSNSISLSIDIDNLFLTSFNYDLNIDIVDYTKWYETNILNPYIVKNFDIYYYPLNNKENSMMVVCINKTLKANIIASCKKHKYELVHLTSDIFSAGIAARVYRKNNIKNYIFEFDENIVDLISSSQLAITRCGASATAELTQIATPFIGVPLPNSIDDHQYLNAKYYENNGCCWVLEQKNFNTNNLFNLVMETVENKNKLETISKNMKKINNNNVYIEIEKEIKDFI